MILLRYETIPLYAVLSQFRVRYDPWQLLITEFIKEVSPFLPNPCHFQNCDQSMSQLSSGSEGCSPKMCADEVNDEDEGEVCEAHDVHLSFREESDR